MEIIYEDKDILALNKPAGIVVHPDEYHASGTLVDEVLEKFPEIKGVGEDPSRPGVVHRLDRDTSGVILFAKNQESFEYLKRQFHDHKIDKRYLVLVVGRIKEDEGTIDYSIGRSGKNPKKRVAIGYKRGKIREARTDYKVLKRFSGLALGDVDELTLVEANPKTGRTHQLRAHFSAISRPVVCDKLYSGKRYICPAGLLRHFLHASSLELYLPSGARTKIEADLPEDLKQVLDFLKKLT